MNQFQATFTNISNWHKNEFYSTGGTRSKYITLEPETNDEYFFKGSKETPSGEIRYPTEFWSEIASSKIGQFLGFPMLDYNIAFNKNHRQKIGCLSKSMVLSSNNKLTEGKTYLTGFNAQYDPDTDKKDYTFQFICNALKRFSLDDYIKNIVEIIVFDSIIGNSDRHQENWGIITKHKIFVEKKVENDISYKPQERSLFRKIRRLSRRFFTDENEEFERVISDNNFNVKIERLHKFAPIYDSGCCLGREHTDERVIKMLNDSQMLNAYINRGESEIHWEDGLAKRKHLELVSLLLQKYPNETRNYILRVQERYKPELLQELIDNIDINLPGNLVNFKLSETRKQLMFKLITLRIKNLIKLL
ncbi:hypothetical protein H4V97_002048 [Flavobacterium sp. CG_23.5]|uniref:hypothetical protein n=1 Tax=unclassified Flavobacterium TaxID=196869 RepID=UPI0018C9F336|nr:MULTISPECIES: hypothetical protein [unclassified Flavobacterium]MBG6110928.1 hypothetical protein [Flavobacterium sp. CG_9.10]MBP2283730.1 hypothetical protein [Flavobacterium sp. CG_23.5]